MMTPVAAGAKINDDPMAAIAVFNDTIFGHPWFFLTPVIMAFIFILLSHILGSIEDLKSDRRKSEEKAENNRKKAEEKIKQSRMKAANDLKIIMEISDQCDILIEHCKTELISNLTSRADRQKTNVAWQQLRDDRDKLMEMLEQVHSGKSLDFSQDEALNSIRERLTLKPLSALTLDPEPGCI